MPLCPPNGLDEATARRQAFFRTVQTSPLGNATERSGDVLIFNGVPGPKIANLIEFGKTPLLLPAQLKAIGY
jgi:hypothetical protein